MRSFLIFIVFFSVFSVLTGEEKDRLAVMEILDDSGKMNKKTIKNATSYLFDKFTESKKYWIIPESERDRALVEMFENQTKQSRQLCIDEKCQLSLSQQLSANFLVNSNIRPIGKRCVLSVKIFDIEKRAGTEAWNEKFDCNEAGLIEAVDNVFNRLMGYEPEKPTEKEVVQTEKSKPVEKDDYRYQGENFDPSKFSEPIVDDWVFFFEDKSGKYYYNQRTIKKKEELFIWGPVVWYRIVKNKKATQKVITFNCKEMKYFMGENGEEKSIPPESFADYLYSKVCTGK